MDMAYVRPLVMVFQEYLKMTQSTQATTLSPCIIGPCFHIVDPIEDAALAFAGTYTSAGVTDAAIPNNYPGAKVEASSVSVRLKDVFVAMSASPYTSNGVAFNAVSFANSGTFASNSDIGDYVKLVDVTNMGSPVTIANNLRVTSVDPAGYKLYLNQTVTTQATAVEVHVTRAVPDFTVASGLTVDALAATFDLTNVSTAVGGASKSVVAAKMYVGYKAMRQDLSEVSTVASPTEVTALLGKIAPGNPLAYGASLCLANTTVAIKVIGVDSEDVAGYTAAKNRLETLEDVYALVPLTQDTALISIFATHAAQMSVPSKCMWRIALGSTKLVTDVTLATGTGHTMNNAGTQPRYFFDAQGAFLSSNVDSGSKLTLTANDSTIVEYVVNQVISEDLLEVTENIDITRFPVATDKAYTVTRALDKAGQAKNAAAASKSFSNARYINVWPPVAIVDNTEQPGYYLACITAGMIGGLPSHQGLTRMSIAGVGAVKYSSDYFNQDQLDIIADGGTTIFVQSNPSAAPYIRHQLTTDMSTLELREISFVKNFDYVSMICRDVLQKFLGQYNVTKANLGILETAIRAVLESLKLYNLPKIGSPVLDYSSIVARQLDDIRDRAEITANVTLPYPMNTIGLHLISQ